MGQATFSRDGSVVAFTRSDVQRPDDVYVAKLPGMVDGVRLTDHNPQVRALALGADEVIRWKGKDGMEIEGVVVYPVGYQQGKRYPTVALIHGGPSGVWSQSFPGSHGNYGHVWAGKGWAVFYPNVRGSSSYGEKFLFANINDWGGGDYQDVQTGIDHLIAKGVADPDKLAQSGWSYGGYMTMWAVTQTNRFRAAVAGAGLANWQSYYGQNGIDQWMIPYFGASVYDDPAVYAKRSPINFIKNVKTPTLILVGERDSECPPPQSYEFWHALRTLGVKTQLVVYPNEGHVFTQPEHRRDMIKRLVEWFNQHLTQSPE
jgi:dipeptidyl aminopeptidase/acylaminoacyl peptidase